MKKILTAGVFDYFHYGHLKLFEQAKNIENDAKLIIAVQEDKYIHQYKPNCEIFYSTETRKEIIKSIRFVDEVITYSHIDELILKADFDIFAVGADQNHQGFQKAIEYRINNNKKVVRLQRTPNISSSSIKTKINNEK